ncbi:glycosyltransferase [Streptomyces sp. NPDC056773]|uniref:glycosyltransferase family 4 protein n=1 Tax=unclassified Streptomyces TaxID=2593676 RepID=UPI003677B1C7
MKISFLINNIYGIGGTNRTVINLAEALSADHEVEIVSVFRRTGATKFQISPQVTVRALVDLRAGADRGDPGLEEPSTVVPRQEEFYAQYSRLSDERIIADLAKTKADVVIGTRPSLNLFVAQYTRESALRVAQEHMTHLAIPAAVRAEMARVYPRLDAVTTVTDADANSFRTHTPIPGLPVVGIPNSVPRPVVAPSQGLSKIVVSAGRMHHVKRYDLLIRAFGRLAAEFPDWELRIYGDGGEVAKMRALVNELGLAGRALLMGGFSPIESEWAKGSIAAVTSSEESFGMTLVEAMRCGLPVVSTDCPVGPREILSHGEDGLLVANGSVDAIAGGLRSLMIDEALRHRMGQAALRNSARYDPSAVAGRYIDLFEKAAAERAATSKYRAPSARPLGRPSGDTAPPATLKTALCHVTAEAGGRLRFSTDGPDERREWNYVLRHSVSDGRPLPDLELRTTDKDLPQGGIRYEASIGPEALQHLQDGRWRVMVRNDRGETVHLKAGIRDTRVLIQAREQLLANPFVPSIDWSLPYAKPSGKLMLRTVRRDVHVESTGVYVVDESIGVTGVVCGVQPLLPGARFVIARRGDRRDRAQFEVPVRLLGNQAFHADVPLQSAVDYRLERWEDWDWWLQPDPATPAKVRVCRLLEDYPDVKGSLIYPAIPLRGDAASPWLVVHPARPVRVRPYTSMSGAMAMNVVDR